uniref:Pre-mRNA splicing Prp18-interacting factor n=1 Tax=Tanacetum cinerariifolium TaxID=118510 RepID=A0A6L2JP12_TANCI|nr:hypothetical protein [Tanacetum cinerariifolium]
MSTFVLCVGCGEQLYGFSPCRWCTCERCGNDLLNGFCSLCNSRNSYVYDPNPNSFDCPPDSCHPSHPTYETYSYDLYGNDSHFGYDCQPQFSLNYESEPGYIGNYNSYPYDSSSLPQQHPCCTRCGGPHETFQCDQLIFNEPYYEMKRLINSEYRDEIKIAELKHNFNVTPSLPTEEPDNSLSMGDEHLDTILATELDEFIKYSVENLIPIPSESKGIPDNMCNVPFHANSPPLDVSKDQFEDFSDSNDEFSSTDDDSFSIDNIDYVEASPPNSELVSSEAMEIVISEVGGIDDDILLIIKDNIHREKLLNINRLITKIEALNDNPTPSFDFMTKSSSNSLNSLLEETNTFDNSLPEFETFCFDVEEISSGSTTYSATSLLEEFTDELSLITYPPNYDVNLQFDIESDLKEIEFLLYQEVESDADNFYNDPFDSKGEKIKEVDALPSTNNEDKVFNPGILIHEKPVKIITRVVQDKKLAISNASLVFEDFDPPFYEPLFFKDVPKSKMLLPFSSENEEKVFKPWIYTSKKVKEKQEKDKIETKPDKNEKLGKAQQCRSPVTVKKAEKEKKIQI